MGWVDIGPAKCPEQGSWIASYLITSGGESELLEYAPLTYFELLELLEAGLGELIKEWTGDYYTEGCADAISNLIARVHKTRGEA